MTTMTRRTLLALPFLLVSTPAAAFVDPAAAAQRAAMIANQVRGYADEAIRFSRQTQQWRRELEHLHRNAKRLDPQTFESVRRLAYGLEGTRQATLGLSERTRQALGQYAEMMKTPESERIRGSWEQVHAGLEQALGEVISSRASTALSLTDRTAYTARVLEHLVDSAQGSKGQLEALGTLSSISGVMSTQLSGLHTEFVRTSTETSMHNARRFEHHRKAKSMAQRLVHKGRARKTKRIQDPGQYKAPKVGEP